MSELYSVPIGGGASVKLNGALAANRDVISGYQLSGDSSRVVYQLDQDTDNVFELYSVPIGGGASVKLNGTITAAGAAFFGYRISPDSSRVVYLAEQDTDLVIELYVWKAQAVWNSSGGDWFTAGNWEDGIVPDGSLEAVIATPTVVHVPGGGTPAVAGSLYLGSATGLAVVELSGGALLSLPGGAEIGSGAVLRGEGVLSLGRLPFVLPAGAELRAAAGERLTIRSGPVSNAGRIEVFGVSPFTAEVEFSGPVSNVAATGAIVAHEAILRFQQGLTNNGALVFGSGLNDVLGDVSNEIGASIIVSGGALTIFNDDVTNNSVINVSAAGGLQSTAVFFGSLTGNGVGGAGVVFIEGDARAGFSPGVMAFGGDVSYGPQAGLQIELGGTEPGTSHDQITVAGHLDLGGSLKVTLVNGFVPSAGMLFKVWEAGSVSGKFFAVSVPVLPAGLFWHTRDLDVTGELRVGLTPESYAGFATAYGLLGGPAGNDDHDGLSNLFEYLTGRNPLVSGTGGVLLAIDRSANADGLSFVIAEPVGEDLIVEVETSTTLRDSGPGGWEVITSRTGNQPWSGSAPVTLTPAGDGTTKVTVSNPTLGEPRRFYRLSARLRP